MDMMLTSMESEFTALANSTSPPKLPVNAGDTDETGPNERIASA